MNSKNKNINIKLIDFIDNSIKWNKLHKIQKLKFVKTMYIWLLIVPITAKLLSKVNDTASLTIFNYTFEANLSLPFTWQIFYFCSVSFVIGNMIFHADCPNLIIDHANYSNFKEQGKSINQLIGYATEINVEESIIKEQNELSTRYGNEQIVEKLFWPLWEKANKSGVAKRINCAIFYLVAFILLLIVFYENTVVVVRTII